MTYNLGKFILTPRGNYSGLETYNKLDIVLYGGSSYLCKSNNVSNIVPTNTTYWQLLAAAGQAVLTPQQEQYIINTLINQGVIVDPYYNTFTTAEKQKLAGLNNPNNGQLSITCNGYQLGTFNANQSGNTTITIPNIQSVGDSTITLWDDTNDQMIGKFTTNQKEDDIIHFNLNSQSQNPNNGQLTIQQGSTTLGTFTANQSTNTTISVPNNTLTIKRNNSTVGQYNPAADSTININVPTSMSDLSDGRNYAPMRTLYNYDNNPYGESYSGVCDINKLQMNSVYHLEQATDLTVHLYNYSDPTKVEFLTEPVTYIYVECSSSFTIDLNSINYTLVDSSSLTLTAGQNYLITVLGFLWKVEKLS